MSDFSNDDLELIKKLKGLAVPDPGEAYWNQQVARLRTEIAENSRRKSRWQMISLWALGGSLAILTLAATLLFSGLWHGGDRDAADEETARLVEEPLLAADWDNLDEQRLKTLYFTLTQTLTTGAEGETLETGPTEREMSLHAGVDDSVETLTDEEFKTLLNQIERIQI